MKLFYFLFILCILNVNAQRRPSKTLEKTQPTETEPLARPVGRGRTRFVATIDQSQIEEQKKQETTSRRPVSRRRPETPAARASTIEASPSRKTYEVQEVIDEIPLESSRRSSKAKVLTETKFEAKNAPEVTPLFQPSTTENLDEFIKSIGSELLDGSFEPEASEADGKEASASEISTSEVAKNDFTKIESSTATTARAAESRRRSNGRNEKTEATQAPRARSRTRQSQRTEETPITRPRSSKIEETPIPRPRSSKIEETPIPRARSSRTEETPSSTPRAAHRGVRKRPVTTTGGPSVIASSEELPRSRTGRKIVGITKSPERITLELPKSRRKNVESTTEASRNRARSRLTPPVVDEQKLEVLPLFERETKTIRPRKTIKVARRRNSNSAEDTVQTSATENNVKLAPKPATTTTTTTTTVAPKVKQSVVRQVSEVTSKRTVTRRVVRTTARPRVKVDAPKITVTEVVSRGTKKSETKLSKKKKDEIDENDNYPEAFKALLQAKKSKESRSESTTSTTEKVVISSSTSSTTEVPPQDSDNELVEISSTRPRLRATSTPTRKSKIIRSTAAPREHRFHAKFNTVEPEPTVVPVKRSSSAKPRGVYSSRSKENFPKKSTQIPSKKSNRYSSRYRNERTSTNAPAYLPTIPTFITPPTKVSTKDKDLGLEVISFDDPVNTVPSANLVSGEFVSSTESPLVSGAQTKTTEKPVSIIERIINSITAISTTELPEQTKTTAEPLTTKQTAILKLATKKPTGLDKTTVRLTTSTEKPTTIIERILNSLSAIQAENGTDQVGSQFNTISSPSTTPISRVTKSTHSAPSSTSISPLSVLDEISNEQTLQKRTIGKLLALLNTLTSTVRPELVVVTPKSTTFLTSAATTTETTTTPTTTTPATTTQIFTSPIASRTQTEKPPTTVRYTTTPTTTADISNELGLLSLSTLSSSVSTTTDSSFDTATAFTYPSTIPELINFEVSPGSVSVFSANDLLNFITPEDSSTITISSRTNAESTTTSDISTIPSTTESNSTNTILTSTEVETESTTVSSTNSSTNTILTSTEMEAETTTVSSTNSSTNTILTSTEMETTTNSLETTTLEATTEPTNVSSVSNQTNSPFSNRSGRLLNITQDEVPNSIETSTVRDKDYFIFAVLNNNTVLRKRPSRFPNKETPFLVVGVYPNNTVVRKFPNGTIVPMDPILRVSGFDIRENPPPLPEITSNQVTPDQGSQPDNPKLQTVEQNTIPPADNSVKIVNSTTESSNVIEANPLSISSTSSVTTTPPSSSSTPMSSTTPVTLPTLTEILNGKTVQAFNSIINISDLTKTKTLDVDAKNTTEAPTTNPPVLSNRFLEQATTTTEPTTTTTRLTTTTTEIPTTITTELPTTTTTRKITTTSRKITTTSPTLPTTTFLPQFLTTLFTTTPPRRRSTTLPPIVTTNFPSTTEFSPREFGDLAVAASTTRRTVRTTTQPAIVTILPEVTTTRSRRRSTTTTERTTFFTSTEPTTITTESMITKKRKLTEQQLKDLQTIAELEREQASLLRQLSFLTNLNMGQTLGVRQSTTERNKNLANRIIQLAVERDKDRQATTNIPTTTEVVEETVPTVSISRKPKKISNSPANSNIEDIIKQLNVVTTVSSPYGNSNDAIIAQLLKEQGIGPTTPKVLEDIYSLTTTKKPRTTTRPPGPLMRSLTWLLNVLDPTPTTTRRPKPKKSKPKPKPKPPPEEVLTHQPTHITPVVTPPPRQNIVNSLAQSDVQKLIKQLEEIQKEPDGRQNIDLSSIRSLQGLLTSEEGVQVSSPGATGTTARPTTAKRSRTRTAKSTTSNNIFSDLETTTTRPRISLPPVRLREVPGIDGDETMVRGQLVTAAVNVTRAITTFLGTALQGAASGVQTIVGVGSRVMGNLMNGSSKSS